MATRVGRNRWLAWLSVVLLVVGLGAGFLVGRVTKSDTVLPSDLAGTTVTKLLDDYRAAVNAGDAARIASFFATDATFTDAARDGGYVLEGNMKIAKAIASWHPLGFQFIEMGTVTQNGDYVSHYEESVAGRATAVYLLKDGKFQNMWIVRP